MRLQAKITQLHAQVECMEEINSIRVITTNILEEYPKSVFEYAMLSAKHLDMEMAEAKKKKAKKIKEKYQQIHWDILRLSKMMRWRILGKSTNTKKPSPILRYHLRQFYFVGVNRN